MGSTAFLRAASAALVLFLAASSAAPRAADAAGITGRVVDKSGDPVPGAVVTFACGAAAPVVVRTDENGRYQSPPLPEEECSVVASVPGLAARCERPCRTVAGRIQQVELPLDLDMLQDQVLVTAPQPWDSVESREIRESFALDAGEAATLVEGVHKIRKGGIANDIVLRGFQGDDVNVLIDGHRLHNACPNRMDPPAFHVDFAEVERIDVKKGPFDMANGGSLGGSVNIVTREPDPGFHASVQAGVESFGYVAPSVATSFATSRWSINGGYAQRHSNPFEDGNGVPFTRSDGTNYKPSVDGERAFDLQTLWAGATGSPRPGHQLEVQATRQEGNTQLYPYLQMDSVYDDANRASIEYRMQENLGALEQVEVEVSYAAVDHFMTDALRITSTGTPRGYSMATQANSKVWGEKAQAVLKGGFTAGVEAFQRNWDSITTMAGMGYAPQYSIPEVTVRSTAVFLLYERAVAERFKLEAGARFERTESQADAALANTDLYYAYHGTRSTSASDTYPSASFSVTYSPTPRWEVFAGVGRTVRAPDPQERYFALRRANSDWVGNPEIAPVKNTEIDLGVRVRTTVFSLEASLFDASINDFIMVVDQPLLYPLPGIANAKARSYVNNDARMWGGEARAQVLVGARVALTAGASYVRGTQDLAPEVFILDSDLPEIPPLTVRAGVRYDTGKWFIEGEGLAASHQDHVDSDLNETPTPGWSILNLRGGVTIGRFSLLAGIQNVFDRFYIESLSYQRDPFRTGTRVPEPGRTIAASVLFRY